MKKKVQYFKIVSPKGHNGMKYKIGLNKDPNAKPLKSVGSCKPGALYFTTLEHLHGFTRYGTLIAWVTPVGQIKRDSDGNKWKASALKVTKMMSFKKAIKELKFDLDERNVLQWREYLSPRDITDILVKKKSSVDAAIFAIKYRSPDAALTLIKKLTQKQIDKVYGSVYLSNYKVLAALIDGGLSSMYSSSFRLLQNGRDAKRTEIMCKRMKYKLPF